MAEITAYADDFALIYSAESYLDLIAFVGRDL